MLALLVGALVATLLAAAGGDPRASSPPEVAVSTGILRGKWIQTADSGRAIAAFEGIPYARPPVRALRFKSPQPATPWSGVRLADRVGEACLQTEGGSEDCLYMNVYAPETVSRSQPLPVMVYVHGGGFITDSGSVHGPEYLLEKDVLLVNFNYRLGALGFLSTGDAVIPGNFGLKDQVAALRWVRDNAAAFGGDQDRVTIFGQSAGAASVHYLTLSPLSKGLFHGAAAMSGSALALWAHRDPAEAAKQADTVAEVLRCPAQRREDLLQCLSAKTAEEIQKTHRAFNRWSIHPMVPFRPTTEPSGPDAFLDKSPATAATEAHSEARSDVPFMTGFTTDEGCLAAVSLVESPAYSREYDERYDELSPMMFGSEDLAADLNKDVYGRLRELYFGDRPIGAGTKQGVIDLFTDAFFTVPGLETVRLRKKVAKSSLFLYQLGYRGSRSFATKLGGKRPDYGMCHSDDLLYLFPLRTIFPQEPSASDKAFSRQLVDLYTTFATTGARGMGTRWGTGEEEN